MSFVYQVDPDWPRQAWIASWNGNSGETIVRHGRSVETHADWFGEIVWDSDFDQAGFDETDIVFGSGAKRANDNGVTFVASATTLDRLHWMQVAGRFFVSNSLICLLAATHSEVAVDYLNYVRDFKSIIGGSAYFLQTLATSNGPLQMVYYKNLYWDGQDLRPIEKPRFHRKRDSFRSYQSFLERKLQACARNMTSPDRKTPFEFVGTASTGFDSTTVAALARDAGLKKVISISSSRCGQDDNGAKIANRLGLEAVVIGRDEWQNSTLPEVQFVTSDAKGEDVYFEPAGRELRNKVLLTGYCGSVWGGRGRNYFDFKRTDQSGLSLSEFRLSAGFINMPVATFGVFQASDLLNLMESDEVEQWSTGRSYDKPFCRFVLSEAGVPDNWYGNEKKAASVLIEDRSSFLTDNSRLDFESYLADTLSGSDTRRFFLNCRLWTSAQARRIAGALGSSAILAGQITGNSFLKRIGNSLRLTEFASGDPRFQLLFPWAVNRARKRFD